MAWVTQFLLREALEFLVRKAVAALARRAARAVTRWLVPPAAVPA